MSTIKITEPKTLRGYILIRAAERDMTMKDVAAHIGIHNTHLCNVMNGKYPPGAKVAKLLNQKLDIPYHIIHGTGT